jgi:hypothetical protein
MIVNIIKKDNLDLVVIDEFYSADELNNVHKEITELYKFRKHPSKTMTAMDSNNNYKKDGTGLFLYPLYYDPKDSPILNYNQKIFKDEYLDKIIKYDINYKHIKKSQYDDVLLNYYNDTQSYDNHEDSNVYTILILSKIGDFTGGGVYFKDIDEEIPFKDNRAIIFPGCATHKAMPIQGEGIRVSIAHFIGYKD